MWKITFLGVIFTFSYTFLVQVRGSQAFPEIGKGGMNTRINLEAGFWEFKEYLLRIWIFICIKYLWSSVPEKFPFWLFSSFGKKQFCIFGCCWKYIGTLHHCPPAQMSFHQIWAWSCAMHRLVLSGPWTAWSSNTLASILQNRQDFFSILSTWNFESILPASLVIMVTSYWWR